MKSVSLIAIVIAAATLLYAQNTKVASDTPAFDGTWSVTMSAHNYDNPNSYMSEAFAYRIENPIINSPERITF
jgi:hypothetical protein